MPTESKPKDLRADDIVLSHFTLARHHDITERLDAAAAAGCNAVGIYIGDHQRLEAEGTASQLPAMLDQRGLCLSEIDALRLQADPATRPTADAVEAEEAALRIADEFECRSLHALAPPTGTTADIARAYGDLCDRAAEHGLAVALEFMPTTAVATAAEARRIVEAADRPNAGICVDAWHHHRGADDLAQIRALPGELIVDVQLSDGPLVPAATDYGEDTRRNRLPPGEGEMDLRAFIEAIRSTGTTAPWALEVCNEAAWETDGADFVTHCAEGLRQLLTKAT